MFLESLFENRALELTDWNLVRTEDPYIHEGVLVPYTEKRVYERDIDGETISLGVFSFNHTLAFIAWGLQRDALCSHHAIAESDGRLSRVVNSCPEFALVQMEGGVTGFSLKAFGRTYLWEGEPLSVSRWSTAGRKAKLFAPLIAAFVLILSFVALRQTLLPQISFHSAMTDFMAAFFLTFGSLKLLNLSGFVAMYRSYDLIAQRLPAYAYAYPFVEIALGILYLSALYQPLANGLTMLLVGIGSVGITRALMRKEEIRCACLGSVFSIPLTTVTLLENLLMGLMAAMMLVLYTLHIH